MANNNEHIVVFENVSARVGGVDISSVIEMSLLAAANAIPQLTLMVDAGQQGGGDQKYVDTVSLSNAQSILLKCRDMIKKDGATLSLSVTCNDVGPAGGGSETLTLSGWLLTDVSLSPIQRRGTCTVALTFQHPICKANLGGVIPGLIGVNPDLEQVNGNNPLEVFISAIGVYASAYRDAPLPAQVSGASSTEAVRQGLVSHAMKAASALGSTVKWTGAGGLPAASHLGQWGSLLVKGLSAYALPSGGTSIFQILSSRVIPECSLALGGDYTESSLELKPFEPWASANLSIDEKDIISLQFPANDPSPISGVKVEMSATGSDTLVTYQPIALQSEGSGTPAEAFYVPKSQLDAEYMDGPIHIFQEPGWLIQMAAYAKAQASAPMSDTVSDENGYFNAVVEKQPGEGPSWSSGGGSGGEESIPAIDYGNAVLACAKAYYETSLMKDWSFTVNTRLMFGTGNRICPGSVLAVKSNGGEILGGYVIAVEHTISVSSKAAHTRIVCSHPRFGSNPDSVGTTNALYE